MANICRSFGYTCFGDRDDEISIERGTAAPPYYVDLCACNSQRIFVVEIDGYQGHKTRRGILKDSHRTAYITEKIGARVYRLSFWQLKGMDENTIAEELGLVNAKI